MEMDRNELISMVQGQAAGTRIIDNADGTKTYLIACCGKYVEIPEAAYLAFQKWEHK